MGQSTSGTLKLGKIGFLNVLPIYYPLEAGIIRHPFTIVAGTPAQLNRLMAAGKLDLSAVSSIEYARHPERYVVLPDLSISSCGPVQSVLLLSRIPIEELPGRSVMISAKSHTSVALLKVLFSRRRGIAPAYLEGNPSQALAAGEAPLAMLVIGDEALRLKDHAGYPYRWDLGQAWHELTGLPFVFGLWVVQRTALQWCNGHLGNALESLLKAKNWGITHLDQVCRVGAQGGPLDYVGLQAYYRDLKFDFGKAEEAGLSAFFHCLAEIGEISQVPSLEMFSSMASVA